MRIAVTKQHYTNKTKHRILQSMGRSHDDLRICPGILRHYDI